MSDHHGLGGGRFRSYPPSSNGYDNFLSLLKKHEIGPGSIPGGGTLIRISYIHIKQQN